MFKMAYRELIPTVLSQYIILKLQEKMYTFTASLAAVGGGEVVDEVELGTRVTNGQPPGSPSILYTMSYKAPVRLRLN